MRSIPILVRVRGLHRYSQASDNERYIHLIASEILSRGGYLGRARLRATRHADGRVVDIRLCPETSPVRRLKLTTPPRATFSVCKPSNACRPGLVSARLGIRCPLFVCPLPRPVPPHGRPLPAPAIIENYSRAT